MADKTEQSYFIIASGGTGMRCLQAFVNTCAIGAFKERKFNILLIDTDEENKDKRNVENLIASYTFLRNSILKDTKKSNDGSTDSFFSSEIILHTFVPDYSTDATRDFVRLSKIEMDNSDLSKRLANIFYEENVQEFNLGHGYRAQTHLGSYLMYHAIISEICRAQQDSGKQVSSQLYEFIKKVADANSKGGRVFTFGSSFGGTGASSIPVIPRAITDASAIVVGGAIEINNLHFGGVVLSSYFKFNPPSDEQKKSEKIIANSQYFAHNSVAALDYYIKDKTILEKYRHLYLLGWPENQMVNVDAYKADILHKKNDGDTKTGGKEQENPAHILELMAVSAAYHFINETITISKDLERLDKTKFLFKSLEVTEGSAFTVSEEDIIPNYGSAKVVGGKEMTDYDIFLRNLLSFYSLGMLVQNVYDNKLGELLDDLRFYNNPFDLKDDEIDQLTYFLNSFSKGRQQDGTPKPGWLAQMHLTFGGGESATSLPKEGSFFGLSNSVFDVKTSENTWMQAYRDLKNSGNPKDALVSRFKKVNKSASGNIQSFMASMKKTFGDLELATVNKKTNA
jgi:hypothetical protein